MLEDYGWLSWIVIGFVAGGLAKLLIPGRDPGGCIVTILLGIGGAMLAGTLTRLLGWQRDTGILLDVIAASVGAVLILLLYRLLLKRR